MAFLHVSYTWVTIIEKNTRWLVYPEQSVLSGGRLPKGSLSFYRGQRIWEKWMGKFCVCLKFVKHCPLKGFRIPSRPDRWPWPLVHVMSAEWDKGEEDQDHMKYPSSPPRVSLMPDLSLISPLFVTLSEICRVTGSPLSRGSSSRHWVYGNCKFGLEDPPSSRSVVEVGRGEVSGNRAAWGWACTWRGFWAWMT